MLRSLAEARDFFLLQSAQNGSGGTKPLLEWATGEVSPAVKWALHDADYSLPSGYEINLLKPNDIYIYMCVCVCVCVCRTAALTSRRYIVNIYSTNIHTEYFKHAA